METSSILDRSKTESNKKRNILLNRPWELESEEFESLCEHFQLTRSESYALTEMRIERLAKTSYEAAAVLSIIQGENNFSEIMAKGRRKSLTVITSGKPSLPQLT